MRSFLELDRDAAVVIPPVRWHDAFVADLSPEVLVEHVVDAGKNSDATVAEVYFGREVPDVVRRNDMLETVVGVREVVVHNRADQADLDPVFPPIDASNFELIIRSVSRVKPLFGPAVNSASSQVMLP